MQTLDIHVVVNLVKRLANIGITHLLDSQCHLYLELAPPCIFDLVSSKHARKASIIYEPLVLQALDDTLCIATAYTFVYQLLAYFTGAMLGAITQVTHLSQCGYGVKRSAYHFFNVARE